MPPLPRLRVRVFDELARQLRFTPAEAIRRYLANALAFADEVDAGALYAEGWLVARITGFRPESAGDSEVVGEAARADLPALIERFSWAARVEWDELPEGTLDAAGARAALGLDAKAIERARRSGRLIAWRVRGPAGRAILAFTPEAIASFSPVPRRARRRLSDGERRRVIELARRCARTMGWSRARAARRLGPRFGVAAETIRLLLLAHDRGTGAPIFTERGPITPREREIIVRAWRRGIEPATLARRLGKSTAIVRRELAIGRARRLDGLELPAWDGPAPEPASDTPVLEPSRRARDLIVSSRRAAPPRADAERALAREYRGLVGRSREAIQSLGRRHPSPAALDRIETDLRRAARIKALLLASEIPLIVRTLDAALGAPIENAPAEQAIELLEASLRAAARAIDGFEPRRGGRLAAPVGLAVQREASRLLRASDPGSRIGRARRAPTPLDQHELSDWTRRCAPWQAWLEPDPRLVIALPAIERADRELLSARFGLGVTPRRLEDLARERGWTPARAAIREREAIRAALSAARALER